MILIGILVALILVFTTVLGFTHNCMECGCKAPVDNEISHSGVGAVPGYEGPDKVTTFASYGNNSSDNESIVNGSNIKSSGITGGSDSDYTDNYYDHAYDNMGFSLLGNNVSTYNSSIVPRLNTVNNNVNTDDNSNITTDTNIKPVDDSTITTDNTTLTGGNMPTNIDMTFPQVSTLTNEVIQTVPKSKMVWLDKTDGVRTVILIENGNIYDITRRDHYSVIKSNITSKYCVSRSILDTEAYENHFIVFDAAIIDGENIARRFYTDRMTKAKSFVSKLKGDVDIFIMTEYSPIKDWNILLKYINNYKSPSTGREIDGVICQRVDMPYYRTSTPAIYKLKLPCMNTIDFYIRYQESEKRYYIYLSGSDTTFRTNCRQLVTANPYMGVHTGNDSNKQLQENSPILFASPFYSNVSTFQPRLEWNTTGYPPPCVKKATELMTDMLNDPKKYDGSIVELSFGSDGWVPFRVRTDKQYPNSYVVGFSNMSVLFDPIDPNREGYFATKSKLSTNTNTINIYHDCSHIIRQHMYETLFIRFRNRILSGNKVLAGGNSITKPVNNILAGGRILAGGNIGDIYTTDPIIDDIEEIITTDDMSDIGLHPIGSSSNMTVTSNPTIPSTDTITSYEFRPNPRNKHTSNTSHRPYKLQRPGESISALDLAGGRGSDILTLCSLGVTNLFASDADRDALVRYARKRENVIQNVKWTPLLHETCVNFHDDMYLNIIPYMLGDDNTPLRDLIMERDEYPQNGFDIIVMNFAFHYICYSMKAVSALCNLISDLLNQDHGIFVMTYVDGDKILSMMKNGVAMVHPFVLELVNSKNNKDYPNADSEMQLIKMPLPTIAESGYRIEPLVTQKYIDCMCNKLEIVDQYYLCDAAKDQLSKIPSHNIATNYLSLWKAVLFKKK